METGSGNDSNSAPTQQPAPMASTATGPSTTSSSTAATGATVANDDPSAAAAGMGGGATPGQSSTSGGPAAPPSMRDREGSFSSYVSSLDGSNVAQLGSNCGSVVEHSPQGRYVRFNFRLEAHAYKEVWKAFDTSEGVEVAWNTLCLDEVPRTDKKRILNEIKILEKLDHPNIITFYTSWFNKETRRIVFITDLMNNNNNGSLMEFVRPIPVLRWKIVKRWLKQILEGLAFLHGQQPPIIHRNINCDNIFIIANTGELKIGDLGLSTAAQRPEGCVGTAPFMAPELFEEDYDERVDIYAFGMAILQMITKKQPYSECENRVGEVYQRVTNHIPPESLATVDLASARAFVELCLEPEPTLRPTATELLEHRFLKEDKLEDGLEVLITKHTPSSASAAAAFAAGPGASGGSLSSTPAASSVFGSTSSGVIPVPPDPMFRRHPSHDSLGSAAAAGVPAPAPAISTRLLPPPSSAGGGGEGGEPLLTTTSGGDVGQSKAQVQVSNGSKLHLRFFSEPHGSFSEVSSDDGGGGDSDLDEEGGADAAAIEASMGDGSLLGSQSGASLVHTGSKGGGFSSRHAHGLSLDPEAMEEEEEQEDYYLMGADAQQHASHAALHPPPPEGPADDASGSPSRSGRAGSGAGVGVSGLTLSLSGLGSFFGGNGVGGSQPARSPRSLLREETLDSNDDDLLSEMPTAESSIKKVKVMGARGTELVEEEEGGDGAVAGGSKEKASPAAGGVEGAADVPPGGGNGEEKKEEGATAVGAAAGGSASKPPAAGGGGLARSKLSSHNMQALLANAISEGMMRRSPSSAAMDEMQRKGSFFNTPTTGSRSASPTAISAGSQGPSRPPPVMGPVGPGGLPPKSPAARMLAKGPAGGGAKKAHFNAPDSPGGTTAAAAEAAAPAPAGGTAAAAPGGPAPADAGVGEPDTLPEALPRLSSYNLSVVEAASWGSSSSGGSGGEDDASSVAGSICSGWSEEGEAPHAGGDHHARVARRTGESAVSSVQQPSVQGKAAPAPLAGAPAGSRGRVMTLLIQTLVKGKPTEVEFEFDLDVDSPPAVAQEMVQELGIPLREMEGLARQIGVLKEDLLAKRAAHKAAKAKHPHPHPHPHPPPSLSQSQSYGSLSTEPASPFPALGPPGPHHPVPSGTSIGHPHKAPPTHRPPGAGAGGAGAAASPAAVAATPAAAPTSRPTSVSAPPAVVGGGTEPPLPLPLESLQALRLTDIDEADAEDEEEDAEDLELQRMKGEYIKSVQRAQKAFKARMESMYKCREDKEEWHRKLLDQYERAMADFDRRLHAATDDQARRLTELRTQFATLRTQHRQSKQPLPGVGGAGGPGMVGSAAKGASASS